MPLSDTLDVLSRRRQCCKWCRRQPKGFRQATSATYSLSILTRRYRIIHETICNIYINNLPQICEFVHTSFQSLLCLLDPFTDTGYITSLHYWLCNRTHCKSELKVRSHRLKWSASSSKFTVWHLELTSQPQEWTLDSSCWFMLF